MKEKVPVAIIGSGNIGTDLMCKLRRSPCLEVRLMVGIDPSSEGLARARALGIEASPDGIGGLLEKPDAPPIVFDATSAKAHLAHAPLLREAGKIAIDLTPAAVGPYVVPAVNMPELLGHPNVNLVTCGGQATVPIVAAVSRVTGVSYAEIVATISSRSAGPGTRQNIDEFTQTTAKGLEVIGGAERGKAIIILNPAEPPIIMRDTIYCEVEEADGERITASIKDMVATIQGYVPGYALKGEPLVDDHMVTTMVEVRGAGDYLPEYSGNLDIMTAAAVAVGEAFAKKLVGKEVL
ncbi:MAG: acetaldehyde dehydrogenase (acetylating) [Nitrospinota bacterium]